MWNLEEAMSVRRSPRFRLRILNGLEPIYHYKQGLDYGVILLTAKIEPARYLPLQKFFYQKLFEYDLVICFSA